MAIRTILFCGCAAFALSACGSSDEPAVKEKAGAAAAVETSPAAVPAAIVAEAATPAKGAAPTKQFMIGRWGENGDCSHAIGFNADGTMDGPFERWTLNGPVLTMAGNPQIMTLSVVDEDTIESRRSTTDKPRTIKRCSSGP